MPPKRKGESSNSNAKVSKTNDNQSPSNAGSNFLEGMKQTPLLTLRETMITGNQTLEKNQVAKGKRDGPVVHWMRMKDLRCQDNRALSIASKTAKSASVPLIVLHVISPDDYKAHERSPARIDFVLRNLELLRNELDQLNIPLHVMTIKPRSSIPQKVVNWCCNEVNASSLYGNIEYEVDELHRDIKTYNTGMDSSPPLPVTFVADVCVVPPGEVLTGGGKPYSVFTPFYNNWVTKAEDYLGENSSPSANDSDVREDPKLKKFFHEDIPEYVEGYELGNQHKKKMTDLWPAGNDAAEQALDNFLKDRCSQNGFENSPAYKRTGERVTDSRALRYTNNRNSPSLDGTSRISPYISAGVISTRRCINATTALTRGNLDFRRESSVGKWVQEIAWRDFYQHVMAAWPRVVKRRPFLTKFENVVWEYDDDKFEAWKAGKTGFPLVDAAMRQLKEQAWMHNRCRMVVASFLSKDLMMDWRKGEDWFMNNLIDGDFASNNGGWQWSSSTGTDPQPFFRIFNPFTQSEKTDPDGNYIRHFVPELSGVSGNAVHNPSGHLNEEEFNRLGYPKPIVDHGKARKRAISRYKYPGEAVDGSDSE